MIIPKNASLRIKGILSTVFSGLHGILYGVLYAPFQVITFFNSDFSKMLPWILVGLPWDAIHMLGNIVMSLLVIPLYNVLHRLEGQRTI